MAAARTSTDPRDRLVAELLARTGMRAGELAGLKADAIVQIGAGHWLRIPLGKLRNDRYMPLHPELVELLAAWTAANLEHIRHHRRLAADHRGPLDRYVIGRIVARVLPADYETTGMARLRREAHARMLSNGLCTRPAELDCRIESACETCAYFRTGPEFLPILTRQRNHAREHGQKDRADLFTRLIDRTERQAP